MKSNHIVFMVAVMLAASVHAADLPLGHPDFIPTPEHPVGFRGDGTGCFPGATPPTAWDDKHGSELGTNILWKTPMPGRTNSSPIVVGGKVFTVADPDLLVCADATTGKILWQKQVDQLVLWPAEEARQAREQWNQELALINEFWTLRTEYSFLQGAYMPNSGVDPVVKSLKLSDNETRKAQLAAISKEKGFVYTACNAGYDMAYQMYRLPSRDTKGFEDRNVAEGERHIAMRSELFAKYGFNFEQWRGWVGNTFRTPICDGKFVYVAMAYGQVACYSLDGDLKWMQFLHPAVKAYTPGKDSTPAAQECGHCPSPVLIGDLLIVQGRGLGGEKKELRTKNRVVALDKNTGKVIWEVFIGENLKRDVGTPVGMKVGGVDLIVLAQGRVLRASDGKVLNEDVIGENGTRIGATAISGDQAFFNWCTTTDGRRDENFIDAYRFSHGPGGFSAKRLWKAAVPHCDRVGATFWDGMIYTAVNSYYAVNASDGTVTQILTDLSQKHQNIDGNTPPSVAGGRAYWVQSTGRINMSSLGKDAKTLGTCALVDDARTDFEKTRQGALPLDEYLKKYGRDKDRFPTVFTLCGGPFFQGNRMYLRTTEYLYCIGSK